MTVTKNASEIVIGGNGTIRVAPVGTTAPTDPTTAYSGTWLDLGFADENGVTITDSKTLAVVNVWQNFYPARRHITARDFTAAFVLRQWNEVTVPLAFGGGTISTTAGPPAYYTYTPPSPDVVDARALGIDWIDGSKHYRLILPQGLVTDNVQSKITKANSADLPITFGIIGVDANAPWLFYTDDPAFAAG